MSMDNPNNIDLDTGLPEGFSSGNSTSASSLKFDDADSVLNFLKTYASKDPSSRDILFNYLLSERSATTARQWEEEMNSKRYQVMVEDLKKAGINPYWLNSLGGAVNYQGSSVKYSGSAYENAYKNQNDADRKTIQNVGTIIGAVVSAIALAVALM